MTRKKAAEFAQRNPDRAVEVVVTFAPSGSTVVSGVDQSAIRARLVKVTVTDAQDDAMLVSELY
jgi:hypothetical protein